MAFMGRLRRVEHGIGGGNTPIYGEDTDGGLCDDVYGRGLSI
jgi:hypothetical protein